MLRKLSLFTIARRLLGWLRGRNRAAASRG
jgi:hypothetical protein